MPFEIFQVPVRGGAESATALNAILRSHRVLAVEKQWVDQGDNSFWCFCVEFVDGEQQPKSAASKPARQRVDYQTILKPEEFALFAKLRDLRKTISEEDSVPVYAIFNNEQLAEMAKSKPTNAAAMQRIDGVGAARVEKYGSRFVEVIANDQGGVDEKSGKSI